MDKGIGFNRNIKLEWLDATAAFCVEMDDPAAIRQRLKPIIGQEIGSATNIRKAIDILLNIWCKYEEAQARLHQLALDFFQNSTVLTDRVWLHYGLAMLTYPFFSTAVTAIGQLSRYEETIETKAVREKLFGELGELGSIREAASRIVFSLRDWGILADAAARNAYVPKYREIKASDIKLEGWMLACAMKANAIEQLPFEDLLRLPALFPFQFSTALDDLRASELFEIERQGLGLNMVRVTIESL